MYAYVCFRMCVCACECVCPCALAQSGITKQRVVNWMWRPTYPPSQVCSEPTGLLPQFVPLIYYSPGQHSFSPHSLPLSLSTLPSNPSPAFSLSLDGFSPSIHVLFHHLPPNLIFISLSLLVCPPFSQSFILSVPLHLPKPNTHTTSPSISI